METQKRWGISTEDVKPKPIRIGDGNGGALYWSDSRMRYVRFENWPERSQYFNEDGTEL